MSHAAKSIWHVACARPPKVPESSPGLTVTRHAPRDELWAICAELAGNAPAAVLTLEAHVLDASVVRLAACALAMESRGVVLSDPPMVFSLRIDGETVPPLSQAWAQLERAAEQGAEHLAKEKAAWQPDPADEF